jgi:hypothetical protein
MRLHRFVATLGIALIAGNAVAAGPSAKVSDLAWMTGTWSTGMGANTLEENWISPAGGGIAAMVRMSGPTGVSMWEVITIEEKAGSLMMSIQQWGSGFEPRTPAAQKLELAEIGDHKVLFKAVTEGSMTSLAYSRSADNTFTIEMGVPGGRTNKLSLKAK